ncbi:MAG: DUF3667 domain-containing protein [Henriciella sp.]|nr:DUF3667 domain-containing protein [Henriciella sp.]
MSTELETLGAASIGGASSGPKADRAGQPCLNCGSPVTDRYCPNCGQLSASFHRPFWSLIGEIISDTFSVDGRIARTLPVLLFRPGVLTRSYTDGKRARYVPPFRLFLISSLIFYLALFWVVDSTGIIGNMNIGDIDRDEVAVVVGDDGERQTLIDQDGNVDRELIKRLAEEDEVGLGDTDFVIDRAANVVENPEAFWAEIKTWTPRISFFLVPLTILALVIMHIWRRSLYVYDHTIHALHLHSWIYLVGTLAMIAAQMSGGWVGPVFSIVFFFYIWRSLSVATASGAIMSFIRLIMMLVFWSFTFSTLLLTAIIISGLAVRA